jgi:carbon storage regulator
MDRRDQLGTQNANQESTPTDSRRNIMLVLTRRPDESIVIDGDIRITVVAVKGDRVRIGVTAPKDMTVDRQEVHERRSEFVSDLQESLVQS